MQVTKIQRGLSPTVSRSSWEQQIKGWLIVGCVARPSSIVSLLLRLDLPSEQLTSLTDGDVPTRLVSLNLVDDRVGHADFRGFSFPRIGRADRPLQQMLISSRNNAGQVWAGSQDAKGMEEISSEAREDYTKNVTVLRLKCIDGWAYAACMFRKVYKRVAVDEWVPVMNGFPTLTREQIRKGFYGFEDIHGLDESNIYAVGGHGDVWRYDGSLWRQCDFPSNEQLGTVTVAPDGKVYITGEGGSLWVGEKDTWERVAGLGSSVLCNDSVWFDDMLWISSDYQLRVWDGQQLRRPQHNGMDITHAGSLSAHDGLLVAATLHEVHAYDGKDWHCLVKPYHGEES